MWATSFALAATLMAQYIVPGRPAGGACTSQSTLYSQTANNTLRKSNGRSETTAGNGETGVWFQADANATLYSITLRLSIAITGPTNFVLRFGSCTASTDCNFSSTYTAEVIQSHGLIATTDNGVDHEFIFDAGSRPVIVSGSGYGWFSVWDTTATQNANVATRNADVWALGHVIRHVGTSGLQLAWESELATEDMYFIIKKCDN